jgi:hypothetical protein
MSDGSQIVVFNVTFQDFTLWGLGRERECGVVSHRCNMFHNLTRDEDQKRRRKRRQFVVVVVLLLFAQDRLK